MISPDVEISRLRYRLMDRGWYPEEVDRICDMAVADINELILDVVSNAVAEATDHAVSIGAEEFIEDMDVVETGSIFMIGSRSGKLDYSVPGNKMLPHLLKNAKTAADGSKYKVIPVQQRQATTNPRSIFEVAQARQREIQAARAAMRDELNRDRSARATSMAEHFRQNMGRSLSSRKQFYELSRAKTGDVNFRTASSKQDASQDWVVPNRDLDLTGYIMDLNSRIQDTIQESVNFIIRSYEQEYN